MFFLLIAHSKGDFAASFNNHAHSMYHTSGDAYAATAKAGAGTYASLGSFHFGAIILLIPFLFFFNLWSNWGATLYGEVRGASDFRKNIYAMGGALLATTAVAAIFVGLFAKTFGWSWYQASNAAYWSGKGPLGVFPYPGTLVAFFTGNSALMFIVVGLLSLWFFGWVGTVFLSSTRVVFEVPQTLNVRHGVFVVENLDTSELAAADVREFALVLTFPKLRGATGAWCSPIALV